MSYVRGASDVAAPMVSPFSFGWSPLSTMMALSALPSSGAFDTAGRAAYYPILVPTTCIIRRLWWANGSTVSATYNVDVGVYADSGYAPGVRLVSTGSTAQGTASQIQFVDVTDVTLPPGRYWLAIVCSSTSASFFRAVLSSNAFNAAMRLDETSALPLPATATATEAASGALGVYLFGFATTASP